jgi:two-component system sensor histidine kinase TtrS
MFVVVGLTVGILREQALRAEKKIKKLGYQYELILNSAGEGILGLDMSGNLTFVNPPAAKMFGYKIEELLGKHSHPIWHHTKENGSPYPEEECPIYEAFRKGVVNYRVRDEVFWRKNGTSFPVAYTSTPIIEDSRITGAVVTFIDITERKRAEEALMAKERQLMLAHASRLSTLGEMATAMAHEINQPLSIVSMAAEGILRDIRKERIDMSLISKDLEDILHNVGRIDMIITHMRTFARQPGVLKVVKPAQILDNAFIIVGEQFRVHDISVLRHIEDNLPHIEVDPNQLEQVFINILINARQVLDEKRETARRAGESFQKQLKCSIFQEGDHVVFEFADNGYGVPDAIKSRIFEPFFTTKEPGQGTGMGLSIAYGIITQALKGRIWVEDNEMGGATFKVALPIKDNTS